MQRQCSGELYRVLDVAVTAPPEEVKKAYRRQALKYHPDKTGGTTTAEFQRVEEANSILSDARRRSLYDKLGHEGLNKIEQLGIDNMVGQIIANRIAVISFFCFSEFLILLVLLFFVFICLRLDHGKQWSWVKIFIPIWILIAPLMFISLVMFWVGVVKQRNFAVCLPSLLLMTFSISLLLFARSLDGSTNWTTTWVFIWFTYCLSFIQSLLELLPGNVQKELSAQGVDVSRFKIMSPIYLSRVCSSLFASACTIAFLIQLNLYITNPDYSNHSFYLTFTPMYIRVCVPLLIFIISVLVVGRYTIKAAICSAIGALLTSVWSLYLCVMLSIKCQRELNNGQSGPSTIVCIFPIFFVLGILTCFLPCVAVGMTSVTAVPGEKTPFSAAAAPTPHGEREDGPPVDDIE